MRLVTVLLLLALAPHPFASAAPIVRPASTSPQFVQVDPVSRQFVDASGRSLLFHGSSVVYKVSHGAAFVICMHRRLSVDNVL